MSNEHPAPRRRGPRRLIGAILVQCLLLPAAVLGQSDPSSPPPADRPSVRQVLAACERGLAAGNVGVDAAMCEWYAVPCDCKVTGTDEPPRWCLPSSESIDTTMRRVVAALQAYPSPDHDAEPAVAGILARLYPCD
jgi:hypothetical protein